jgi:hypothetical protein
LLGLVGVDADPVQSREHILLSTIIETAWRAGQDLDIPKLIMQCRSRRSSIGVLRCGELLSREGPVRRWR